MSGKTTLDFVCNECGTEYMIIYESDYIVEQPMYCPFCSERTDEYEDIELDDD